MIVGRRLNTSRWRECPAPRYTAALVAFRTVACHSVKFIRFEEPMRYLHARFNEPVLRLEAELEIVFSWPLDGAVTPLEPLHGARLELAAVHERDGEEVQCACQAG